MNAIHQLYELKRQHILDDYLTRMGMVDEESANRLIDLRDSMNFHLYCNQKALERDLEEHPEYPPAWETAFQRLEADLGAKAP